VQDLPEVDLRGILAQGVAAAGAADALDELVDLEGDDDLLEVTDRDLLFIGDVLEDDGMGVAVSIPLGEVQHEPCPVASFGRKPDHACLLDLNIEVSEPIVSELGFILIQNETDYNIII
jgi:hypothetical protein